VTILFINEVYLEAGSNRHAVDSAQGSLFAEGGIKGALELLNYSLGSKSYSSLEDTWAKLIVLDEERGQLRILIIDESSKLNLNTIALPNGTLNEAYADMLRRLLAQKNLELDLVDTLADWIDQGDTPNPGGAEADWYLSQKQPYRPRNGYLLTLEELAKVKGFAGDPLEKLRPFVTVYSDAPAGAPAAPVNINTAPREVLAVLDERMNLSLADQIIERRKLTPFSNTAELTQVAGMQDIAPSLQTKITTKGTVYRITAEATVNGTIRTIEVVARLGTGKPAILYWREY
jgi:general secretion pathway protein K